MLHSVKVALLLANPLLFCSLMFSIFSFLLSGDGEKKISLIWEMSIFHVLEGTPKTGKSPTKKIYVY